MASKHGNSNNVVAFAYGFRNTRRQASGFFSVLMEVGRLTLTLGGTISGSHTRKIQTVGQGKPRAG